MAPRAASGGVQSGGWRFGPPCLQAQPAWWPPPECHCTTPSAASSVVDHSACIACQLHTMSVVMLLAQSRCRCTMLTAASDAVDHSTHAVKNTVEGVFVGLEQHAVRHCHLAMTPCVSSQAAQVPDSCLTCQRLQCSAQHRTAGRFWHRVHLLFTCTKACWPAQERLSQQPHCQAASSSLHQAARAGLEGCRSWLGWPAGSGAGSRAR